VVGVIIWVVFFKMESELSQIVLYKKFSCSVTKFQMEKCMVDELYVEAIYFDNIIWRTFVKDAHFIGNPSGKGFYFVQFYGFCYQILFVQNVI